MQGEDRQRAEDRDPGGENGEVDSQAPGGGHGATLPARMITEVSRPAGPFYAWLALCVGLALLLALLPEWRERPTRFVLLTLLMAAVWAVGVVRWGSVRGDAWRRWLVGAGLALRLIVALHPPDLSPDIHRYAWDGRLLLAGVNPYAHAPEAAALEPWRDGVYEAINYKEIPTIYPPLAQLVFALGAALDGGTTGVRLLMLALDAGVLLVLARLLVAFGLPDGRLLIYAACPLPLVEVASSGHVEPLGILCLLLMIGAVGGGRSRRAGLWWGAACLGKIGPLVLAPVLARRAGGRAILWGAAALVAGLAPFAITATPLVASLSEYGRRWRAHGLLFEVIDAALRAAGVPAAASHGPARWICAALLVAVIAAVAIRRPDRDAAVGTGFARDIALVVTAATLLSPTLHPWYLLWLLALQPLVAWPACMALAGTACAFYLPGGTLVAVLGALVAGAVARRRHVAWPASG